MPTYLPPKVVYFLPTTRMAAPSSPSKLRSIVTGCAPVSEAERDARWSKMAAQFPSSNVNNNSNKRGSPSSPGKENQSSATPGVTVPASAFQQFKSPRSPVQDADGLASYPVRPLACTPPRHQHHQPGGSPHRSLYDGSPTKSRPKANSSSSAAAASPNPSTVLAPLSASSSPALPRHAHTRTKSMPPSSVSPQIPPQPQTQLATSAKAPQTAVETRSVKVAREFEALLVSSVLQRCLCLSFPTSMPCLTSDAILSLEGFYGCACFYQGKNAVARYRYEGRHAPQGAQRRRQQQWQQYQQSRQDTQTALSLDSQQAFFVAYRHA